MITQNFKSLLKDLGFVLSDLWLTNPISNDNIDRTTISTKQVGSAKINMGIYLINLDVCMLAYWSGYQYERGLRINLKIGSSQPVSRDFYELEPFISWYREIEDKYLENRHITIR